MTATPSRCQATWVTPLGRHQCILTAGHKGGHARSAYR